MAAVPVVNNLLAQRPFFMIKIHRQNLSTCGAGRIFRLRYRGCTKNACVGCAKGLLVRELFLEYNRKKLS